MIFRRVDTASVCGSAALAISPLCDLAAVIPPVANQAGLAIPPSIDMIGPRGRKH
jgi:hypothetical protein